MIFGIGTDLCRIDRMEKSLNSPAFWQRVFTPEERTYLEPLPPKRKAESAAACFAAKEAFLKAVGTGLHGFALGEVGVAHNAAGAPAYALSGRARAFADAQGLRAHLSLGHENGVAIAFAVLEKL